MLTLHNQRISREVSAFLEHLNGYRHWYLQLIIWVQEWLRLLQHVHSVLTIVGNYLRWLHGLSTWGILLNVTWALWAARVILVVIVDRPASRSVRFVHGLTVIPWFVQSWFDTSLSWLDTSTELRATLDTLCFRMIWLWLCGGFERDSNLFVISGLLRLFSEFKKVVKFKFAL